MPTHELIVPDWLPTSVNELLRMHYHARARAVRSDCEIVAGYALQARIPHAAGRRRVRLTFSAPGGRGFKTGDVEDNRRKNLLDALVKCGLLVDDSPKWVEVTAAAVRGPKQTVIVLEDVEP